MSRIRISRGGARGKSPKKRFSKGNIAGRASSLPMEALRFNRKFLTGLLTADAVDKATGGQGFKEGGVVRCADKSDKPMKIKKTKKVAKRGQRGVGAAKRGFGRAVV
tara:strand:- start:20 stop:340 length:321 start_codon:yes stop_codon:yes gene_type:complete